MTTSTRQQKDMSLTVVLGTIEKAQVDPKAVRDSAISAPTNPSQSSPQSLAAQTSVAKSLQNTDAVVSTLRSFRGGSVGSSDPIKDVRKAEKLADELADKIRENKDGEATSAHDGLSSEKSASALVN